MTTEAVHQLLNVVEPPHRLYRFFGEGDVLLYIGITDDLPTRWTTHRQRKMWWPDVRSMTVDVYPTREALAVAEVAAIKAENPLHNIAYNRSASAPASRSPDLFSYGTPPPPSARPWTFAAWQGGYERTVPLWLCWEVDGDQISDDYLPDEVDAVELWGLWRRTYPPGEGGRYGPGLAPITWFVEGPGVIEWAPFQDQDDSEWPRDFLTEFTWPHVPETGEPLRWTSLPVVDKLWRAASQSRWVPRKGGFIQEATGWKPAPFQPYLDVPQLERAARL